ncbi:MAG: glycosyl hydrolase, partial [Planctomycetes bacterium]|nr:glycosyl hydrolase [Planctomycetota bacterium]
MPAAGPKHKLRVPRAKSGVVQLLVGTRKGAFVLRSDRDRLAWRLLRTHYLGHVVHHFVADPREPKSMLIAARTGHLGPTIFRSEDSGSTWKEASRPPAFDEVQPGRFQRVVNHVFWLTPGHASEPGVWYAGTSPQGLFRTRDAGRTWKPVAGLNSEEQL